MWQYQESIGAPDHLKTILVLANNSAIGICVLLGFQFGAPDHVKKILVLANNSAIGICVLLGY